MAKKEENKEWRDDERLMGSRKRKERRKRRMVTQERNERDNDRICERDERS